MDWSDILIDSIKAGFGVSAAAYALGAVGLNLQVGFTGLLNLGHAASMLVGAYGTAIAVDNGLPLGLGVLIGIMAAIVLGVIIGMPTLRLRADYLAIVTLALAEILRVIVRSNWADPFTNSVYGIQRFADAFHNINPFPKGDYGWGRFSFSERTLWLMSVGWIVVAIATVVIVYLIKSPWGRALKSVREDEDAARSLGKNVFLYKLQSLVIGGVLGGMAGIVLALDQQNVNPDSYLPLLTFWAYIIIFAGGTSKVWGPIAGAILFWFSFEMITGVISEGISRNWFGSVLETQDAGPIRFVFFGVALMVLLIFRPQGLFGNKEEVSIEK